MTVIKLKHVDKFKDRHGRWRYYFRRNKGPRVVLPGRVGTQEFMEAYQQALQGVPLKKEARLRGEAGTFDRLVQDYFSSADFLRLASTTRKAYRGVIERFVRDEKVGTGWSAR